MKHLYDYQLKELVDTDVNKFQAIRFAYKDSSTLTTLQLETMLEELKRIVKYGYDVITVLAEKKLDLYHSIYLDELYHMICMRDNVERALDTRKNADIMIESLKAFGRPY